MQCIKNTILQESYIFGEAFHEEVKCTQNKNVYIFIAKDSIKLL